MLPAKSPSCSRQAQALARPFCLAPKHITGFKESPFLRDPFADYLSIYSQMKPGRPKHLLSLGPWLSSKRDDLTQALFQVQRS